MKIKSTNPRFTSGMELNGNVLSGDTFTAKDNIKKFWGGKWDSTRKVWIVNPERVMETLNSKYNWGLSISNDSEQPSIVTAAVAHSHNGICPKCHTYCYGDCDAH